MKYKHTFNHIEARFFSIENTPEIKGKRKSIDYRVEREGENRTVIIHDDGTIERI